MYILLSSLEYCAPAWMLSAESHMGLLDSIGCVRASFVIWGAEGRVVLCVLLY